MAVIAVAVVGAAAWHLVRRRSARVARLGVHEKACRILAALPSPVHSQRDFTGAEGPITFADTSVMLPRERIRSVLVTSESVCFRMHESKVTFVLEDRTPWGSTYDEFVSVVSVALSSEEEVLAMAQEELTEYARLCIARGLLPYRQEVLLLDTPRMRSILGPFNDSWIGFIFENSGPLRFHVIAQTSSPGGVGREWFLDMISSLDFSMARPQDHGSFSEKAAEDLGKCFDVERRLE